jgi:DNA excision repair protein ERCC-4
MGSNSSTEFPASSTQNSLTRKAGGRKELEKETQVHISRTIFFPKID